MTEFSIPSDKIDSVWQCQPIFIFALIFRNMLIINLAPINLAIGPNNIKLGMNGVDTKHLLELCVPTYK